MTTCLVQAQLNVKMHLFDISIQQSKWVCFTATITWWRTLNATNTNKLINATEQG